MEIVERLHKDRDEAEIKALDSLSRYKFAMFGYWAGIWVHLNRIIGDRRPSPFRSLTREAGNLRANYKGPGTTKPGPQGTER